MSAEKRDVVNKKIINGIPFSEESIEAIKRIRAKKFTKTSIKVMAVADGYYAPITDHNTARIVKAGETFNYEGILKDGRLPLWVRAVDDAEARKKGIVAHENDFDLGIDYDELEEVGADDEESSPKSKKSVKVKGKESTSALI